MKLGLDIHGVITRSPDFFSKLSKETIRQGHEVHLLTGASLSKSVVMSLINYDIAWTRLFSITDYHLASGITVDFDKNGNPWIEESLWDRSKAEYCAKNEIDFYIDDSDVYGKHFTTPYCFYNHNRNRFQWFYNEEECGEFLIANPDVTAEVILGLAESLKESKN